MLGGFNEGGIGSVIPSGKNSLLIDLRWLRWKRPFVYRGRTIDRARRHLDPGTVYLFRDAKRRGEQLNTLEPKLVEEDISREEFEQ